MYLRRSPLDAPTPAADAAAPAARAFTLAITSTLTITACSSPPPTGPTAPPPPAACLVATAAQQATARDLVAAGRFARALTVADAVTRSCPEAAAALAAPRARALAELGQCAAIPSPTLPRPEAESALATCAARTAGQGDPARTRAAAELAIAAWPLLAAGRVEEARIAFDAALAKAPVVTALVGGARARKATGDEAGARRLFDRAHARLAAEGAAPRLLLVPHLLVSEHIVTDTGQHLGRAGARLFVADPASPERVQIPQTAGSVHVARGTPRGLLLLDRERLTLFAPSPLRRLGAFQFPSGHYLEVTADGSRVLVAGSPRSAIVDFTSPATPKELHAFEGTDPSMSADGKLVGFVTAGGVEVRRVDAPADLVASVAGAGAIRLSANGKLAAVCLSPSTASKGPLALVDLDTGKERWRTRAPICWGARMDNVVPPDGFSESDRLVTAFGNTFEAATGQPTSSPDGPARKQPPEDWLTELGRVRLSRPEYKLSGDGHFVVVQGVDTSPAFRLAPLSFVTGVSGFTGVKDTRGSLVAAGPNPIHVVDLALGQEIALVKHDRCAYPRPARLFSAEGTHLVCMESSNTFESLVDLADAKNDLRFHKEIPGAESLGGRGGQVLIRRGGALEWYDPRTEVTRPAPLPEGALLGVSPRLTYAAIKTPSSVVLRPLAGGADIPLPADLELDQKPVWSEDDSLVALGTAKHSVVLELPLAKKLGDIPAKVSWLAPGPAAFAAEEADGLLRLHLLRKPARALFWARDRSAVLLEEPESPTRPGRVQIAGDPSPLLWCEYGEYVLPLDLCRDVVEDPHLSADLFAE